MTAASRAWGACASATSGTNSCVGASCVNGPGVGFADGVKELISHSFALRRAPHQSRNVHKFDAGRNDDLGLYQLGERRQPFIGHGYNADVWFVGGKRVVRN